MRARADMQYTPVIVLTAETEPDAQLKALELGATDFLTKPVNPSELRLRVRNALAFKANQDRLADFDALTGLVNRRKFSSGLNSVLADDEESKRACALLHIDLDRFKVVNETLGQRGGDKLLCAAAQRMEQVLSDAELTGWPRVRSDEMKTALARIAGNGFAALLPNLHNLAKLEKATSVARSLLASLAQPFDVDDHRLSVTASIGIAVFPDDSGDADVLMKNAETAMYQAKQRGGHTYEFFSGEMKARAQERLSLERQLRHAVEHDQLVLYFQPQVEIVGGQRITGAEALVRWRRPEVGIVTPDKFMSIAEDTGIALDIGKWVLRAACQQAHDWSRAGLPPISIAVNIASVQFHQRKISETVHDALTRSGLPAERLVLELKESALMENADRSIGMLYELKEIGVKLALNDFCMSSSSLVHLSRFPIDEIKIDRSFVAGLPIQTEKAMIVSAICALAKELRFRAIAVGVETAEQLNFLRAHQCEAYQGNLFSRPAPAEPFTNLLRRAV
jgi:diguanylate cyclase (GGDEF)-like protein